MSTKGIKVAVAVVLVVALSLATRVMGSSGHGNDKRAALAWYINPDDGGQAEIARRCTAAAGGRYRIETALLPRSASDQREQLLRRLAAKDSSIDLMSLDVAFVPEFAEAGFLAPIPKRAVAALTEGVVGPAVTGATWKGRLAAAPMWANTQLLWYRKSVARQTGLDPSTTPVTWDQIVKAARQTHTTVALQAKRYEGYTVLVNALVESSGGHIIKNPGARADDLELGLDSPAGDRAAAVIHEIAHSGAVGPSLSTEDEEASRALFQSADGAFLVNWPYVWRAANAAADDGSLSRDVVADIGWARYPRANAGVESRPPLGGIDLGVGRWSRHLALALDAIRCITSPENERYYFVHEGNPAARANVFDDPQVRHEFPMAQLIRASLEASAPRPQTERYSDLSAAIQRKFHPPGSVNERTPASANAFATAVLRGNRLP
jgi:trehalose/maltose transport system substrate-binding protein